MRSGPCRATGARLTTAIATSIAVIFATAPFAQAAPTAPLARDANRSISASQLPLLVSEPPAPTKPALPGLPGGGRSASQLKASQSPDRSSKPEAIAEVKSRRNATTRVVRNDDASLTIDQYSTPIHYQNESGAWVPIDNTLRSVPGRPGWVATNGNDWSVAFGPLSRGLELSTDSGVISMVPVTKNGPPGAAGTGPEVSPPTQAMGPQLAKDVLAKSAVPEAGKVAYQQVQPGVDLRYEVRGTGVKEDIILADNTAGSEFVFDISGAGLVLGNDGGVRLAGPIGNLVSVPPPTVLSADGSDLTVASGVHYEIRDPNGPIPDMQLAVVLSPAWLAQQAIFRNGHFGAVGKDWAYTLPLIKARGPISVFVSITTVNFSLRYVTCHSLPLALTSL